MHDLTPAFFMHDDDDEDYDDVDQLFSHLETIEPPSDMVARIMNVVSKMPSPEEMLNRQQQSFHTNDGGLIADETDREPS